MSAAETLALLQTRAAVIPAALREVLAVGIPRVPERSGFVVTGGGLSEGPARFLVALLDGELGGDATYWPLSSFAVPSMAKRGGVLVLFSQGLAPNARLPLEHLAAFDEVVLFTSVRGGLAAEHARRGVHVVTLPPVEENGLLLRIIGPACASLAAARYARPLAPERFAGLDDVPAIYETPARLPGSLVRSGKLPQVALVAGGHYLRSLFGLRWKLLEGLHVPDPPIWDFLQVAHGPFQSFYDAEITLLSLERAEAPHEAALADKLAEVLVPERHRLLRLRAARPSPLAWFEHDALFNALLFDALGARPTDLARWPGQGHDGPLYEIAPPVKP
ncbi:MAG TPA: hypothetical protein VFF06_27920 [Polyangia bacterium]|nr:hypothetical protein [Polyangia bacterium]